jgi:hypothetical protein
MEQPAVRYRARRTYQQQWNSAVFGPSVANAPTWSPQPWASRTGDTILAAVPLYSDGRGNAGFSLVTKGRTALYRNNTLVGETTEGYGLFEVPAGRAAYRIEESAERGAPHTLSTRVSATWTFTSEHVDGDTTKRLPLSSVRFSPRLDQLNTAPVNRTFDIPVTVDRQATSSAAPNRSLTVQVSYDDGRTWQKVSLRGDGDHRTASVRHPNAAGFVSLRAEATDTAGNTVTQTVIRAYRIG